MPQTQAKVILQPSMVRKDLYVSYPLLVKRSLFYCKDLAFEHKFKTLLILLGFAGAYASYGFYRTVKMMFDPFGFGGSVPGDPDQANLEVNQSQQQLKSYIGEDPQNKRSIEIFQKTQNSVKDNLSNQISFMCRNVVAAHYKLQDASDRTKI